jgi:hypothetical protein
MGIEDPGFWAAGDAENWEADIARTLTRKHKGGGDASVHERGATTGGRFAE